MPKRAGARLVPWWRFKLPRRWHRCRVVYTFWRQTYQEDRCACGATRTSGPGGRWFNKNCRRSWEG